MYKLSCQPLTVLYVAENKVLAGREGRSYEGEALGRKLAFVFFEAVPGPGGPGGGGLVRRVHRETVGMHQVLMTVAEVLQSLGAPALPADPERTPAETEQLTEALYEGIHIARFECRVEPAAPDVHMYSLGDEEPAELAHVREAPAELRTKMALARCLEHNAQFLPGETLQSVWNLPLATLRIRAAPFLPAPAPGKAPGAPPPAAVGARGRGRGRGRGRA